MKTTYDMSLVLVHIINLWAIKSQVPEVGCCSFPAYTPRLTWLCIITSHLSSTPWMSSILRLWARGSSTLCQQDFLRLSNWVMVTLKLVVLWSHAWEVGGFWCLIEVCLSWETPVLHFWPVHGVLLSMYLFAVVQGFLNVCVLRKAETICTYWNTKFVS